MIKKEKKPTARALKAEKTRETLLDTAFELFTEHGFDNVTVEDITNRAGVSKGTFYSHFTAKESVLVYYFRQVDELYENTYRRMSRDLPVGKKLLRLVNVMCRFCEEKCGVEFMRVIYANQLLHSGTELNILNEPERRIREILREIAEDGKKNGEVPPFVDNEIFAREMTHLAHGIIYDWCMENGGFDLRKEGKRIFSQIAEITAANKDTG